jgi:hypothetical protein
LVIPSAEAAKHALKLATMTAHSLKKVKTIHAQHAMTPALIASTSFPLNSRNPAGAVSESASAVPTVSMVAKAWNRAMHVQRKGPNAWQDPSKARYASLMMPLLPQHCLRDSMLHAINAETTT